MWYFCWGCRRNFKLITCFAECPGPGGDWLQDRYGRFWQDPPAGTWKLRRPGPKINLHSKVSAGNQWTTAHSGSFLRGCSPKADWRRECLILRPGPNVAFHMSRIECKLAKRIVFAHLHSIRLMWSATFDPGPSDDWTKIRLWRPNF